MRTQTIIAVFAGLLMTLPARLQAQRLPFLQISDCLEILTEAQEAYTKSDPFEMIQILDTACVKKFSWQQRVMYYRLLTLSYLFQEPPNPTEARKAMLALLSEDPEFPLRKDDPAEWKNLYYDINVRPMVALRVQAGVNGSFVNSLNTYGLDNTSEGENNIRRSPRLGYQFAIGADFFLHSRKVRNNLQGERIPGVERINWELGTELAFQQNAYHFKHTQSLRTANQEDDRFAQLSFTETQQWFSGSVWLRHNFDWQTSERSQSWTVFPYVYIGLTGLRRSYIRLVNLNRVTLDVNGDQTAPTITDPAVIVFNHGQRANYNLSVPIGAGLSAKLRRHYFQFDLRYHYGLTNFVDPQNRYRQGALLYRYGYVDSDLSLNQLSFSLGYRYATYRKTK